MSPGDLRKQPYLIWAEKTITPATLWASLRLSFSLLSFLFLPKVIPEIERKRLSQITSSSLNFRDDSCLQGLYGRPMGINLTKSSSTSVGARVVEWGREGLDGRPRPVPCAHLSENALPPPPAGDHQGPPHIRSTALAPTDHPASCLASRLRFF